MYKLYGWHYYILLLSAIIFVLLCHDFLAWMGSRILTKKMLSIAISICDTKHHLTGKAWPACGAIVPSDGRGDRVL